MFCLLTLLPLLLIPIFAQDAPIPETCAEEDLRTIIEGFKCNSTSFDTTVEIVSEDPLVVKRTNTTTLAECRAIGGDDRQWKCTGTATIEVCTESNGQNECETRQV